MRFYAFCVKTTTNTLLYSHLKGVIVGFYNEDELMRAKDILLKATLKAAESMDINLDLPHKPNRRQGDKKCSQTTDDII